jgi:hypothetical protein
VLIFPLAEIFPNELVLNVSASNPLLALTLLALIWPIIFKSPLELIYPNEAVTLLLELIFPCS